jgi:hypothetical protein
MMNLRGTLFKHFRWVAAAESYEAASNPSRLREPSAFTAYSSPRAGPPNCCNLRSIRDCARGSVPVPKHFSRWVFDMEGML